MVEENKTTEPNKKIGGWALASFTLGLIGVILRFSPILGFLSDILEGTNFLLYYLNLSIFLPILIIIFGIIGLKKKESKPFSIIGILFGLVYFFSILIIFLSLD